MLLTGKHEGESIGILECEELQISFYLLVFKILEIDILGDDKFTLLNNPLTRAVANNYMRLKITLGFAKGGLLQFLSHES